MNLNEIEIKNNAIIHKDNSLNRLDLSFLKHIELSEYKKSELLAYWIYDYAVYHDEEKTFNIALINQVTTISKQIIFKDTIRRNVKISNFLQNNKKIKQESCYELSKII